MFVIGALAAAYATIYAARRGVPPGPVAPPAPPPPATDEDEGLLARLWFEMLSRGEAMAAEVEVLRHDNVDLRARLDVAEAERLDLLRRLARGDSP